MKEQVIETKKNTQSKLPYQLNSTIKAKSKNVKNSTNDDFDQFNLDKNKISKKRDSFKINFKINKENTEIIKPAPLNSS